jgi:MFS superfamily sulfate permease-like transporter
MMNFLIVVLALGFVITTFASGIVVGLVIKIPSRIERIRQIRDGALREIDETVDYYLGLQKKASERVKQQ